jgi:hypothetical protein
VIEFAHLPDDTIAHTCAGQLESPDLSAFVRTHLAKFAKRREAPITVIALSPPVPFHLEKVKSSTSSLTRSF